MNNMTTLTAQALLAINPSNPEHLFTGDAAIAKQEFRALVSRWHPDRCPTTDTTTVFQHINQLYETATRKLQGGIWQTPGLLVIRATDGATYKIRYRKEHTFELGRLFIGQDIVAYLVENSYADLVDNAVHVIDHLPCADARMAAEISPYLPEPMRRLDTAEGCMLVLRKAPDQLLLRDLLAHRGGHIEARHVAWMISSLLNLACYLDYARLTHNAILTDTWFVSPPQHCGALLGGWWYAVAQGAPLLALPATTVEYAPFEVIEHRLGDPRTDRTLIRALGRALLGDVTGTRLVRDKAAPPAMLDWLQRPAGASAIHDYHIWCDQVLKDSFGKRRFTPLDVSFTDVYGEPVRNSQ